MQEPQTPEKTTPESHTPAWHQACDCVLILQSPVSESMPTGFLFDAIRFFAERVRVFKVLPDLEREAFEFAAAEDPHIELLHVYNQYGPVQSGLINEAILSKRCLRPALYLDNWRFFNFYMKRFAPLKVLALKETVSSNDKRLFHKMLLCSDLAVYGDNALAEEHFHATGYKNERLFVPWLEQYYDEARYPKYMTRPAPPEMPGQSPVQKALDELGGHLDSIAGEAPKKSKLDILMLCDRASMFTNALRDYAEAFHGHSGNNYSFADASEGYIYDNIYHGFTYDLNAYDAVIIHFSVRQCYPESLSRQYIEALKRYGGYKVLMIQDDYDYTEKTRKRIEELGVHEVFSIVPGDNLFKAYPPERFPGVRFHTALTGYVTREMTDRRDFVPLGERKNVFCYRGRALPYYYGVRGYEKLMIGKDMRRICEEKGLPCDIEWTEEKRIYGAEWDAFISGARATLASESASNMFDDYGYLRAAVKEALKLKPDLTFQEAFDAFLKDEEGKIEVNILSPKMFEAISHKTALVMYTGEYSGILKPEVHYIELKKDYSNIDEVLEKVMDDEYITALTERAYEDIIASGRYSYQRYVEFIDGAIRDAGVYSPPSIIFQLGKGESWTEPPLPPPPARVRIKMFLASALRKCTPLYNLLRQKKGSG